MYIKKLICLIFFFLLRFSFFRKLTISKKYLNIISYLIEFQIILKSNKISSIKLDDIEFNAFLKVASIFEKYGLHDQATNFHKLHAKKLDKLTINLSPEMRSLRLFTDKWFSPIGHIALIDVYIKAEMMGIIPKKNNLLISNDNFSNKSLLKYLNKYINVVNMDVATLGASQEIIEENLQIIKKSTGYSISLYDFCSEVQHMWEQSQNKPLLKLDNDHREMGYETLKKLGYKDGDWFCGLHVRSSDGKSDSIRNANIYTYQKGINELNHRGGLVFNISSREGIKIDNWKGIIDYSVSPYKSDWMDVFILAEGDFLIATGSGPSVVPVCFGRPAVFTNWGPLGARHCSNKDILLPKHYWSNEYGRFLNFRERMSGEYGYTDSGSVLKKKNIEIIDNSPDEISSTLLEMYNSINELSDISPINTDYVDLFKKISSEYKLYPVKISNSYIESGKY